MNKKYFIINVLIIFIAINKIFAISFNDSGWDDYGKTPRTKIFSQRKINVTSPELGQTGFLYIHKKGEATRGKKYPYLPFGIATFQRNWRMSGLFDFTLNGENNYLYKHLSAVPKFEYIHKTFEAINLKITFPCGSDGNVIMLINVSKGNNYFDFTFDLSQFKKEINKLDIVFNSFPGHSGRIKNNNKFIKVPLNRIFRTASRTIKHNSKSLAKLNKAENWLILYDQESGYGSCAIMFDSETINACTISGNKTIAVAVSIKKGSKKIRFLLWEFIQEKYNIESAYSYMSKNSTKLLESLRKDPKYLVETDSNKSYKAVQTNTPPKMDGKSNDKAWKITPWSSSFCNLDATKKSGDKTQFKIIYDAKNLYLLIDCEEKYPSEITAKELTHDSNKIFRDDSIEMFLSPQNSSENYFQMAFNTLGTKWEAIVFPKKQKNNKNWNPKWDVVVNRNNKGWTAEVKIPFMSLLLTSDVDGKWMLNIARNDVAGKGKAGQSEAMTWSKLDVTFHDFENFNLLTGINEDLHYALQEKEFEKYGMKTVKRRNGIKAGIEIVKKGNEKAYLYYPTKEIYLPDNGTVLRTIFNFKESRNKYRDLWSCKRGKAATKEYLKNISFHFLLPEGVTTATDMVMIRRGVFKVVKKDKRHIILYPQWPANYGEMWYSISLKIIPIFLKHKLKAGQRVPIDSWMEMNSPREKTSIVRSYINIIKFPWVKKSPKKFSAARIWSFYSDIRTFPDYVETSKLLGFTSIPFFTGDFLYDGGQNNRKYDKNIVNGKRKFLLGMAAKARKSGMEIFLNDTTFNKVGFNKDTQWGGLRTGFSLGNPAYRGPLYYSDINDVVTAYKLLNGAERISMDIECFKRVTEEHFGFLDKGKKDYEQIKELAKKRNTTIEDVFTDYGTEMMADLQKAILIANKELGITKKPDFMVWNVSADEMNPMEGLFDYKKLYPKYNQLLNPHVYFESDPRKVGNRIKLHRRILGNNDFIACLTMRHQRDDLAYHELRDQILECFYNGAGGIDYWPMLFDQNDAYGQLLALKEIYPFEKIIWNGKFFCQTKDDSPTQIVGFKYNNQAVLLVSNYQASGGKLIKVNNPLKKKTNVYNVSSSKSLGKINDNDKITIKLNKRNTAVIYFDTTHAYLGN
jgi:Carbohydrate family 9 binding domain-like